MNKIEKALQRLTEKERQRLKQILIMLEKRNFTGLDVKKLVGQQTVFRVRAGQYRIIFRVTPGKEIDILGLEKRSDHTYKHF